jgi:hypothetical protein
MIDWKAMLKGWRAVAFVSLVTALILAALGPPQNQEPGIASQYNPLEYIISLLSPEGWTALWTCALSFSTVGLWLSTYWAARRSEDHLKTSERAYVFMEVETSDIVGRIEALLFESPETIRTLTGIPLTVQYRAKNYGKTPAIIRRVFSRIRVSKWPDSEPQIGGIYWPPEDGIFNQVVGPSNTTELFIAKRRFTAADAHLVSCSAGEEPQATVWFFGQILYDDIFGQPHDHRFLWRYDWIKNTFDPYRYKNYSDST